MCNTENQLRFMYLTFIKTYHDIQVLTKGAHMMDGAKMTARD